MASIKEKIKNNRLFVFIVMSLRRIFKNNVIKKAKGNIVAIDGLMKGARVRVSGFGNEIRIFRPKTNEGLNVFVF